MEYLALIPVYLPRKGDGLVRYNRANQSTTLTKITKTTLPTATVIAPIPGDSFFVFDFLNAKSGISIGKGGRTVAATVGMFLSFIHLFDLMN